MHSSSRLGIATTTSYSALPSKLRSVRYWRFFQAWSSTGLVTWDLFRPGSPEFIIPLNIFRQIGRGFKVFSSQVRYAFCALLYNAQSVRSRASQLHKTYRRLLAALARNDRVNSRRTVNQRHVFCRRLFPGAEAGLYIMSLWFFPSYCDGVRTACLHRNRHMEAHVGGKGDN